MGQQLNHNQRPAMGSVALSISWLLALWIPLVWLGWHVSSSGAACLPKDQAPPPLLPPHPRATHMHAGLITAVRVFLLHRGDIYTYIV